MNEKYRPRRPDFWRIIPLEVLAKQQGVSAVFDLDEISALWPADDDPDELLQHILLEPNERRKSRSSPGWPTKARGS